jgi:SAM-dependent methyltransferase
MYDLKAIKARIDWSIAPGDQMFHGDLEHYTAVGESAQRCILAAQMASGVPEPTSILDFACGNGRVTRWLRAAWPDADLHVSDINADWVSATATRNGATGWPSTPSLVDIVAPRSFDLIWCGSLATHLSANQTIALFGKFRDWLTPEGIAVVTTHGRRFLQRAIFDSGLYFPDKKDIRPMLAQLATTGFGYEPYSEHDSGVSVATPAWVVQQIVAMPARVVGLCEHGWDDHQDVVAFQRSA